MADAHSWLQLKVNTLAAHMIPAQAPDWQIVDGDRLGRMREVVQEKRPMSLAIPVATVALLAILALIAKERKYEMTSAGLLVLTGVMMGWLAWLKWMFG
jgi:hypothetical protein